MRDCAGYGLAQWTYWSRKQGLFNFAKAAGRSIGDLEMQLDFLMKELREGYKAVLTMLKTAGSVRQASDAVLLQFERPADQSETAKKRRASFGQKYYDRYAKPKEGQAVGTVKPRLTRPEAGNKYYITKASGGWSDAIKGKPVDALCNTLSNCVGYAYGRFNEIGGYGCCKYLRPVNAENFIQFAGGLAVGQEPKLGACMVWRKGATLNGSDGAGHVATGKNCKPCEAKVTAINPGSKHPYHVVGTSVYGWVDEDDIAATASADAALAVGDRVKMDKSATIYGTMRKFAAWVYAAKLYVRGIDGNRVVVSTLKSGAITGAVDKKHLTKV